VGRLYDDLFAQHRVAERLLGELAQQLNVLAAGGLSPELLDALAVTHRTLYADADHHFKEEERALFPLIAEKVGGGADSILAPFLEDHRAFWQEMDSAGAALAALQAGRSAALPQLHDAVGAILVLLPDHIEREDTMLFPMAREVLSADEWVAAERSRP